MKKFDILQREMVLQSRWMPVEKQLVQLPNGTTCEWFVSLGSDVVIVVPLLRNGNVMLQRAYKHGSGEVIIEFCAGMIDEGETPEIAAHRELLEESGLQASALIPLGTAFANPTGSRMRYHFFLAKDCQKIAEPQLESAEQIVNFAVDDLTEACQTLLSADGNVSMAALAALSFAQNHLDLQ